MIPNYQSDIELSQVESDPRYQELCTKQMRTLQQMNAKFAQERVSLAIAIKKERNEL